MPKKVVPVQKTVRPRAPPPPDDITTSLGDKKKRVIEVFRAFNKDPGIKILAAIGTHKKPKPNSTTKRLLQEMFEQEVDSQPLERCVNALMGVFLSMDVSQQNKILRKVYLEPRTDNKSASAELGRYLNPKNYYLFPARQIPQRDEKSEISNQQATPNPPSRFFELMKRNDVLAWEKWLPKPKKKINFWYVYIKRSDPPTNGMMFVRNQAIASILKEYNSPDDGPGNVKRKEINFYKLISWAFLPKKTPWRFS